ncbi:stalk domain-containing protein [Solibacillus sp. FSL K6-1523]|uniref:stalk domain-containing protein n=1 Tax=Solibacillus sp. FSL K6-1523 TaxID=2921471 RepID=UPI0030FA005D
MKKWFTVLFLAFVTFNVTNHVPSYADTIVEENNIETTNVEESSIETTNIEENVVEKANIEETSVKNTNVETTTVEKGSVVKKIVEKNNVTIIINGEEILFRDPILNESGHLLLPMRDFYEAIGATVFWDQENKIASSIRNNQKIDLTINSKTALVNGEKVQVSVAPTVYKDRTYIPMRFVSENSNGYVYWDEERQVVEVILNDTEDEEENQIPEVPQIQYTLYMNNKKIMMDDPIINKDGRMYIPSSYFVDHLQNSFEEWTAKDRLELTVSGLQFKFMDGSSNIFINDDLYTGAEKPFVQNDKMYVPVKFIVDSFKNGGSLRYVAESNTMYISMYDYMLTSDFLEKSYGYLKVPQLVENVKLDGNRELLVSDNPEELTPDRISRANETLSEYKVQGLTDSKLHRVYGWHINKLGERATIAITIQNTSDNATLEITNSKGMSQVTSNSWSTFDVGLPLSDAVLTNTLADAKVKTFTLAPGETKVIDSYELGISYLLGFTHDFDVRKVSGGAGNYTVRTVISLEEYPDLTSIHSPVVPINPYAAHPRGVWPSSSLKVTLPTYTVDTEQVGYNISNGKTDHLLTAENSLDKMDGTVGNPGHFGMTYKVDIPVENPSGKLKYVLVKIAGRGGVYSGAVKMNGKTYLIPTLKPGEEYVQLPVLRTSKKTDKIELEIIHAGGSNLPVAVYVETR